MVDAKEVFLKKLRFVFRRGLLHVFRVQYNDCLAGIKLKDILDFPRPYNYILITVVYGNKFRSLDKRPIVLLTFDNALIR